MTAGRQEPDPSEWKIDDAEVALARTQQVALIGKRIRALRRERMTLSQLAAASNVSVGLLSRLENGVGNPSFAALSAIARALEADVHSLFEVPSNGSAVLTSDDRLRIHMPRSEIDLELLVPDFHSPIIGCVLTLPPSFRPPEQVGACPGQMFETVLEGSVEFHIEHEVHQLAQGDSILFEASRPHCRHNMRDSDPARILTCSTEIQLESYFPPRI